MFDVKNFKIGTNIFSKFTIALICFQSRIPFILKFQIKLFGKTDLKGGCEFFMFVESGMG
jgi:hypothetical protein